ncbi:hypothetical protein KKF84_04170 [Myxococcota bacterium]|nr:hypothetical protein [Myxococcota bacterium]MBU1534491.1 hypothetical protein [Myxococcota bacterium]
MPRTSSLLTTGIALFFVSLLGARFITASWWTVALYPLAFSIGLIALLIVGNFVFYFVESPQRRLSLMTFATILAIVLSLWLLAPVKAPPPDPFLPDRPPPFDWRSIFSKMLTLPLALHTGLAGFKHLVSAFTSNERHGSYLFVAAIAAGCAMVAINRLHGALPFLLVLAGNLVISGVFVFTAIRGEDN